MNTNEETQPEQTEPTPVYLKAAKKRDILKLTLRQVAAAMGIEGEIAPGTLNRWLKGGAVQKTELVEAAAIKWLTETELGDGRRQTPFVETLTSRLVHRALEYAWKEREMVFVVGEPGLGKTRSIHEERANFDPMWIATATASSSALVPCLQNIATAVGILRPVGGARALAHDISAMVARKGGLLVIDEVQHLGLAAFDEIRSMNDAYDLAIALVGSRDAYSRMTTPANAAQYGQIRSRIGLVVELSKPLDEDVEALAGAFGVDEPELVEMLVAVSLQHGALRNVSKVLHQSTSRGRKPTAARIKNAIRNLCKGDIL